MTEGSTIHLYFGNSNDYSELSTEKPSSQFGDNNYYSVYCKEEQDLNNVYDIYVVANGDKVYFPKESDLFFSKQSIPFFERHLISVDFNNIDTSNVITMQSMFSECKALISLNLSEFYTSNVFNMNNMFYECSSLQSLDMSGFNTSKVTDMNYMFNNCNSLKSLDVIDFVLTSNDFVPQNNKTTSYTES